MENSLNTNSIGLVCFVRKESDYKSSKCSIINAAACSLLGISKSDAYGKTFDDLFPQADLQKLNAILNTDTPDTLTIQYPGRELRLSVSPDHQDFTIEIAPVPNIKAPENFSYDDPDSMQLLVLLNKRGVIFDAYGKDLSLCFEPYQPFKGQLFWEVAKVPSPEQKDRIKKLVKSAMHGDFGNYQYRISHQSLLMELSMVCQPVTGQNAISSIAVTIRPTVIHEHETSCSTKGRLLDLLKAANKAAQIGAWELDPVSGEVFITDQIFRILEVPQGTKISLEEAMTFCHPDYRQIGENLLKQAMEEQKGYDVELKIVTKNDQELWVRSICQPVVENNQVVKLQGVFQNIDRRKRMEEHMIHHQKVLDMALEAGMIGVWKWESEKNELSWDKGMFHNFDLDRDQFRGNYNDFIDCIHEDDKERVNQAVAAAIEGQSTYDLDYRVKWRDGSIKHIAARGEMIRDDQGKPLTMIGICMNITDRKKAEQKAEEVTKMFQNAMECSAVGMALVTLEGKWLKVNDSICNMLGYTASELLAIDFQSVTHPDDLAPDLAQVRSLLDGEKDSYSMEKRYFHKNGQIIWVILSVSLVRDSTGTPKYFVAHIQDITERKNQQLVIQEMNADLELTISKRTQELENTKELYRDLYDNAPDMYLSVRVKDGIILECNQTLCHKLGYQKEEIINTSVFQLYADNCLKKAKKLFTEFVETGVIKNAELQAKTKTGHIVDVLLNVTARRDKDGKIIESRSCWQDISFRKSAVNKITQLNRKLETRVTELDALNQELQAFSYSVSHDLRAPLRSLHGFSEALMEDYGHLLDKQGTHFLSRITNSALYMSELIDGLLKLSRVTRQAMECQPVDATALVRDIYHDLNEASSKRTVQMDIQEGIRINGDPDMIRVVLQNLLGNAWKYTKNETHPRITFGTKVEKHRQVYFIQDNGVGFNPEYKEKLFGAFQRLHSAKEFPGTGIGLATVQRIIHRHGGVVWAEGNTGEGATFYFTLPKSNGSV